MIAGIREYSPPMTLIVEFTGLDCHWPGKDSGCHKASCEISEILPRAEELEVQGVDLEMILAEEVSVKMGSTEVCVHPQYALISMG